jgi:hypothetical protein
MGKRTYGGDDGLKDPAVDAFLGDMADEAEKMAGGAPKRRGSTAPAPSPATVAAPAAAPVAAPSVLKAGLTKLLDTIKDDAGKVRDTTEQAVVDGLSAAYQKVKGKIAPATVVGALMLNPTPIKYVMGLAQTVLDNMPSPDWKTVYENYSEAFSGTGDVAMSAVEFAGTPKGVLMIAGILLATGAQGAGKTIPEYIQYLGSTVTDKPVEKIKGLIGHIKGRLDRFINTSPAADLNVAVRDLKEKKEMQAAVDAYLDIAKAKDAAEAQRLDKEAAELLIKLSTAPVEPPTTTGQGRRRKTNKGKKSKRRVTRRSTKMPVFAY